MQIRGFCILLLSFSQFETYYPLLAIVLFRAVALFQHAAAATATNS